MVKQDAKCSRPAPRTCGPGRPLPSLSLCISGCFKWTRPSFFCAAQVLPSHSIIRRNPGTSCSVPGSLCMVLKLSARGPLPPHVMRRFQCMSFTNTPIPIILGFEHVSPRNNPSPHQVAFSMCHPGRDQASTCEPRGTIPVPTTRPCAVSPWGGYSVPNREQHQVRTKAKQPGQYICFQKVCSSMFCRSFLPACWELSLPCFS